MSAEQVETRAKETWKAVRDLLERAEDSVEKELHKAAPAVQKSLETSMDSAAKGFSATLKTIDSRTESEQLGLLKAYRKFLTGQVGYVEGKLKSLEERAESRKSESPPPN